jgi:hypothetical protein
MTVKIRAILSALTLAAYFLFLKLFVLVESPLKGAISAQQLNDTVTSYAANQAAQNRVIETTAAVILVVILFGIWAFPFRSNKTN